MTLCIKRFKQIFQFLVFSCVLNCHAQGQTQQLTVCWAAWDPANALVDLSKDFTKRTGIEMKFIFVAWPDFTQRMLNELNSKGTLCDVLIGDSQWLGSAATQGHYLKLNDFFDKNAIDMDDFIPATVDGYATWPKGTKNYWAIPAMGDAVAWTYRKDWFARPEIQKEFHDRFGRELTPPTTWLELKDVAQFFQGRLIDGKKVYGAAIYTERGSEGITMGATSAIYANGGKFSDPNKPHIVNGYINGKAAVEGLQMYRDFFACCTPPGHSNAYMTENLDVYKSGQVAMQMNFIALFPGTANDPLVGGERTGFFKNPRMANLGTALGGQGMSVVKYSEKKALALEYIKWFAQPATQQSWWDLGGFTCLDAVLNTDGFKNSKPYATVYLESMKIVKDFWQEPSYAELLQAMQIRLHDYVVIGTGSSQDALNGVAQDWTKTLSANGKIESDLNAALLAPPLPSLTEGGTSVRVLSVLFSVLIAGGLIALVLRKRSIKMKRNT